jgi:hypothetical protein
MITCDCEPTLFETVDNQLALAEKSMRDLREEKEALEKQLLRIKREKMEIQWKFFWNALVQTRLTGKSSSR